MPSFNVDKAKAAGYTDSEIQAFLNQHPGLHVPLPKDVVNEKGLQDISMTPITDPMVQQTGQMAAEKIGEKGYPKTGAVVGTAIQMAPDIAAALSGTGEEGVIKKGAELAEPLAESVAKTGRTLMAPSRELATQGIKNIEEKAGIGLEDIGLPEKIPQTMEDINKFANTIKRITSKGADRLARKVDPQTLQTLRKTAGMILDNGTAGKEATNFIASSKEILERALDTAVPFYQQARSSFKDALAKEALLSNLASKGKAVAKGAAKLGAAAATGGTGYAGYRAVKNLLGN